MSAATPEDVQLRQQADDYNRTVVEGVAVGAVVGAVLGGLLGGGRGALIGGLSGLAVGAAAGTYVANKKEKYAVAEDRVNAEIAEVQDANQKAAASLELQKKLVENSRARLAELQAGARTNSAMVAELKSEVGRSQERRILISKIIDGLKKKRDDFQEGANADSTASNAPALNSQIAELNKKIEEMESQLKQLDESIAVSAVS